MDPLYLSFTLCGTNSIRIRRNSTAANKPLNVKTEKKKREKMLAENGLPLIHVPRVIGETDGETDTCYDFPFVPMLQRLVSLNPDICRDITNPPPRRAGQFPINDIQCGTVYRSNQLAGGRGTRQGECKVMTMWYCDGVGVNNPIGAFHNNHNLVLCYCIVVELRPEHRLALHNIFPVCLAFKEHFTRYPISRIVHGFVDEPMTSSSFGIAMLQLGTTGIPLTLPSDNTVITCYGGCLGIVADAPARASVLAFNEGFGPNTISPCMGCNYCQQSGHDGLIFPQRRPNTFLPNWNKKGKQVWKLHTHESLASRCTELSQLSDTELSAVLPSIGLKSLRYSFENMLLFQRTSAPFGIMHVEYEGNAKVHIAALVYMLTRVLEWCSLKEINDRHKCIKWSGSTSDKPPLFRKDMIEGTDDGTPHPDASVPWKAAAVKNFMMSAIDLFEPFIRIKTDACWICFKLHCQYFEMLHLTSFSKADILKLDCLIYQQQVLFLSIPQYASLWKLKNHFATHLPIDILKFGHNAANRRGIRTLVRP